MIMTMNADPIEPPSGRVARKRSAVRLRLIRAGFLMVGRQGLGGFAVADLTDAADCSKGAFYSHFDSRDAFVERLMASGIETVGRALDDHSASLTADAALAIGLLYTLTLAQQQPDWGRFVAQVVSATQHVDAGFGRRLIKDLDRGKREDLFTFDTIEAALLLSAGVFLAGVVGASQVGLPPRVPGEATRLTLLGLGVPPARAKELSEQPIPLLDFKSEVVEPLRDVG
ncbi:TetR/AcrR family transcriptional regulator [Sphingomonas sp.]|uniref:TetR/AcrR family transcriptional regulator n=1 Tax=Sphingomonas sp. TaxID=28214 RepID=UPI0017D25265|nr:TetR/AcrR family transcriptional regulator [Sphingomonas sp.]MBA4761818.1 TetR/AcrR family transcriptional regulator [Sphingomonas sp.]